MAQDFERNKHVTNKRKNIAFGYVRMLEHAYFSTKIIPDLVYHICLLFYFYPLFDNPPKCIQLFGDNQNKIKKINDSWSWQNALYSTIWIPSTQKGIYKWRIQVHDGLGILCGIISNKHHQCIDRDFDTTHSWTYTNSGRVSKHGFIETSEHDQFTISYTSGDEFTLILDLNKGFLSGEKVVTKYGSEDIQQCLLFDDIPREYGLKYKFAVSLFYADSSITVNFESIRS